MERKGNKIENWDNQYKEFKTTYTEQPKTAPELANYLRFQFILEDIQTYLPNYQTAKFIEVGCGGARTSLFLSLRGCNVTCCDFSPEAIRLAQDNFSSNNAKGTFVQDDFMNSKLQPESYDCIMSFGLLEHFENINPVINNITKYIKPGGIQIHNIIPKKFSTQTIMHTLLYPYTFLKFAFKGDFNNIIKKSFRVFPHFENTFSAKYYCKAFENSGNTILKCEPEGFIYPILALTPFLGKFIVSHISWLAKTLIKATDRTESKILHTLSPTFNVICRKN